MTLFLICSLSFFEFCFSNLISWFKDLWTGWKSEIVCAFDEIDTMVFEQLIRTPNLIKLFGDRETEGERERSLENENGDSIILI